MLVDNCGDCKEPIPFDPCSFLGYNPGVDGHLFKSKEAAQDALDYTREAIIKTGYEVSAETSSGGIPLHGPLMEDGGFWSHCHELIHFTHESPCIIESKCAFTIRDASVIKNVHPIEIELFI